MSGGVAFNGNAGGKEMVRAGMIGLVGSAGVREGGRVRGVDRRVKIWRRYDGLRWRN